MTSHRPTESHFETTSWTRIANARQDGAELSGLLAVYWSPVYAYLRRKGHRAHVAADMTQAFMTHIVLARDLVGRADQARGRFRSFLITSLERYLIDERRHVAGRDGSHPRVVIPRDPDLLEKAEPREEDAPADAFDRQWATAILGQALERVALECEQTGLVQHWRAFELRVVRPALHGTTPPSLAEIAREIGVAKPEHVSPLIHTVKRKFRSILRDIILQTVEDSTDVEEELAALRRHLVA